MNISSPRMMPSPSPGGGHADSSLVSPTPTDIQDTNSSHSDQLINNSSSSTANINKIAPTHNKEPNNQYNIMQTATANHHSNQNDSQRKNLKTEYKSNFTPFDQYVYNEITDSFVKQQTAAPSNNLLIRVSASNSNQNLASAAHSDMHATNSASPALEVNAFEPNNGSDHHYDVTKEPWYKEVVKRNEKANEYRFKSEVGHNSPLFKDGLTSDEPMTRRSPLCIETLMDSYSTSGANGDNSSPQAPDELSSKRSYKFTPHDYKRDHLIATMANNNNFNLPKKQTLPETSRVTAARRVPAASTIKSSSARPLTRTPAQVRARSQSSRRQNMAAPSTMRTEPATKSNQTTPVKTMPSRITTTARVPASLTAAKSARAPVSSTTLTKTTTRTTNPTSNGAATMTRPSSTISRRSPMSAPSGRTTTNVTTSRLTNNASVTTRQQTAGTLATKAPSTKPISRGIPAPGSTTKTASTYQQAPKSPAKRVVGTTPGTRATSTTTRPLTSTSARNSMSTNKTPVAKSSSSSTTSTTTNAIKSIKTKALTNAGEKAAAALASDTKPLLVADSTNDSANPDQVESANLSKDLEELTSNVPTNSANQPIGKAHTDFFMNQEPNLIFTTSETGNMLADEIAQAERLAKENELLGLSSQQVNTTANLDSLAADSENSAPTPAELAASSDNPTTFSTSINIGSDAQSEVLHEDDNQVRNFETKINDQPGDLVNGLTGQTVSAEDRYDSSEHDASVDFEAQQTGQSPNQIGQNNDDEPYSIMPTTFDAPRQEVQISEQQNFSHVLERDESASPDSLHEEILPERIQESTSEQIDIQQVGKINDADEYGNEVPHSEETPIKQLEHDPSFFDKFETNREVAQDGTLVHRKSSENTPDIIELETPQEKEVNSIEPDLAIKNELTEVEQAWTAAQQVGIPIDSHEDIDSPVSERIFDHESGLQESANDYKPGSAEFNTIRRASGHEVQVEKHDDMLDKTDLLSSEKSESTPSQDSQGQLLDDDNNGDRVSRQDSESPPKYAPSVEYTDLNRQNEEIDFIQQHQETDDKHKELEEQNQHDQLEDAVNENSVYVPDLNEGIAREDPSMIDTKHQSINNEDYDQQVNGEHNQQQQQQNTNIQVSNEHEIRDEHESELNDGEDESLNEPTNHNELLMNVADLVGAESRKKQEMSKKSELARQQSNSRTSLNISQPSEILLSADQLNEQFAQSNDVDAIANTEEASQQHADDNNKAFNTTHENEVSHHTASFGDDINQIDGKSGKQQETHVDSDNITTTGITSGDSFNAPIATDNVNPNLVQGSTDDLVNFGSLTSSHDKQDQVTGEAKLDINSQQSVPGYLANSQADSQTEKDDSRLPSVGIDASEKLSDLVDVDTDAKMSEHGDIKTVSGQESPPSDVSRASNEGRDDDSDDDEQQKLSNHLTNSDDDVILEPRNTKNILDDDYSPHKIAAGSRYNEGAGLGLMTQEEQLDGLDTAELADGSSAEIVEPTVAEQRVELSTSKSMMPDILPSSAFVHAPIFSQGGNFDYDDDDQDLGLNPDADPIDVAATMSPSSSVAEGMLRLSRNASNASTTNITSKLIDELSISKSYSSDFARGSLTNTVDVKEQSFHTDQDKEDQQAVELAKHANVDGVVDSVAVSTDINIGLDRGDLAEALESKSTEQVENSSKTISGSTDVSNGLGAGTINISNNNINDISNTMDDSNNTKPNSDGNDGDSKSDSDNSGVSQVPSSRDTMKKDHKDEGQAGNENVISSSN